MMEMAGLAQKGGAVHIHVRHRRAPGTSARSASPWAKGDTLIGGDLVVSAGPRRWA
jgi:indolepyruvate ferredoxin oxidoreductase